jgi:hypothetical protein
VSPLEPTAAAFSSTVFDALPFAAFVADSDLRILATNPAARRLVGGGEVSSVSERAGEALRCINSSDGCGKSAACTDCVIRGLTTFAISGGEPARRRARLEYRDGGSVREMFALVTASPLDYDGRRCALVCIENLTLLLSLADAMPICMGCRKVRDEGLWTQVEAYLDAHLDLKFSHGLCPECARRLYPDHFEPAVGPDRA